MKRYRIVEIVSTDLLNNKEVTYAIQERVWFWWYEWSILCTFYHLNGRLNSFERKKYQFRSYKEAHLFLQEYLKDLKYRGISIIIGYDTIKNCIIYLMEDSYGDYSCERSFDNLKSLYDFIDKSIKTSKISVIKEF